MTDLVLELPGRIEYVAGYVNGVLTVFHQDILNLMRWRASVGVAEDNLYRIDLEIHDEAGNVGTYQNTIEYILPVFIYDRVQADVDRVYELRRIGWENLGREQREEWLAGMKGCLNTSDLKRIENDIFVIAQLLRVEVQTNKDNLPDIPDTLYFQRLLKNVQTLRETKYIYHDTPDVPAQPLNTYEKINDVEHILHDIYWSYEKNNSQFLYCGNEIYAGEEMGLL